MEVLEDKSKCCGCHACYNICPRDAITMKEDEKGFIYPTIDREKCIECGGCRKVCPVLKKQESENKIKAYAAYNKDEETRKQSSSGGIFTLLAEVILSRNGVVFGASFDEDFNVIHTYVENKNELHKFRGSKYVQSLIEDTYKKVKQFLENDRYVLFTGTPCQIEGLKSYLNKDYDKLYTQDIICHGVPSPKVWRKYLEYRKSIDRDKPVDISFRNKDGGWKYFRMKFIYKDKYYSKDQTKDLFMNAFLRNTILRDSCYNCSFKKKNRVSDITLADFWGIDNILPEMNDNKGTSLVIVNSKKGQELIDKIREKVVYKEVGLEEAIKYNPSMIKSATMDKNRDKFFENMDNMKFDMLIKRYTKHNSLLKRALGRVIRKFNKKI